MERRFILFLVLSFAILMGYWGLMQKLHPPKPRKPLANKPAVEKIDDKQKSPPVDSKKQLDKAPKKSADAPKKTASEIKPVTEPKVSRQWVTLGSADHRDPYRMLVTLTNKGAAVARIELNNPRYCDVDERYGYLGQVIMEPGDRTEGCLVQVVGHGTPAAEAGLRPGDIIKALGEKPVADPASLEEALEKTRPKQTVQLTIVRGDRQQTLTAKLRRRPVEVIQPENHDPLSMLLTLQQFDDQRLSNEDEPKSGETSEEKEKQRRAFLDRELPGVKLRRANWRLVASDQTHAEFRRAVPEKGIEFVKTYRLAKVPDASQKDSDFPAYHLIFEIEIRNIGDEAHKVAYRLDGPNGLPTEGKWYASKVSRNWGGAGLRDFVISFGGGTPGMTGATTVADGDDLPVRPDTPPDKMLTFIGVDAQYFSAVLMPERENPADVWFEELLPICVGKVDPEQKQLANTSCRLISTVRDLKPGEGLRHQFKVFTGPKNPALLEHYGLGELVYYGWPIFAMVAKPLTAVLHGFYAVFGNYGLAIILLTVLVRACMFPLSLKQVLGAQKMQMLQPEIKKLQEKHKNNVEARTKAQQELFRKHNYNPLSGCFPIFIQMPIFIGLYRALMVDIALRDAPLISHSIRWCSNLAAPDMLFNWSGFMPEFINSGQGIFGLGPYLNLLPMLTIVLFIWQQKMFMPPPADEQAAMQQKIMKYMMIFMGLLFFKVASGLCIYFIVSSLWGIGERKVLPKTAPAAGTEVETRAQAKAQARQAAEQAVAKKKKK